MITAPDTFEGVSDAAREALRGAIDLHAHAGPDPFAERKLDARGLVDDYAAAGLAGFVLKSHEYPTQPLAYTWEQIDPATLSLPSGWTRPSGLADPLHLVTDYESDEVGRTTQQLGPEHEIDGPRRDIA